MKRSVLLALMISLVVGLLPQSALAATDPELLTSQTSSASASTDDTSKVLPASTEPSPETKPPAESSLLETEELVTTDDENYNDVSSPIDFDDYPIEGSSDIVVTALQTTAGLGFLELYNTDSTKLYDASHLTITVYLQDGSELCEIHPTGFIVPESHAVLSQAGVFGDLTRPYLYSCGTSEQIAARVVIYEAGTSRPIEDIRIPPSDTQLWVRKGTTASKRSGIFTTDFEPLDRTIYIGGWYVPPAVMPLVIVEVLVNPRDCTPADETPDCYDFVKVFNPTTDPVDLADYRLRSGFINSRSTTLNTAILSGVVQPGETRTIIRSADGDRLSLTANDGTVWFEDEFGISVYISNVPAYIGSGDSDHKGRSWANDPSDKAWKWATPAPGQVSNDFSPPPAPTPLPCPAGEYRSSQTGRCRQLATASTLKPCHDGQYRSEITNRCRSLALAGGTLKPCKDGQYRNETTNRCRNIATLASTLKPCQEGWQRNPETNRCRKIRSDTAVKAAFAVEPIAETAKAFTGWWALGGIGILALAYAGWEWRREVTGLIHRLGQFISTRR